MNKGFIGATNGASNHSSNDRVEHDFYATDPVAVDELLKVESFNSKVWECACGNGAISKRMAEHGYTVYSSDKYNHGYGDAGLDFLEQDSNLGGGDIVTNPPFKDIVPFILHGLELTDRKLAIFARIQLLETKKRWEQIWSNSPLKKVVVFVNRVKCYPNGLDTVKSSGVCYAWFIWDKQYTGAPVLDWSYKEKVKK